MFLLFSTFLLQFNSSNLIQLIILIFKFFISKFRFYHEVGILKIAKIERKFLGLLSIIFETDDISER